MVLHERNRRTDVDVADQAVIVADTYRTTTRESAVLVEARLQNIHAIVPLLETLVDRNLRRLLVPIVTWNMWSEAGCSAELAFDPCALSSPFRDLLAF